MTIDVNDILKIIGALGVLATTIISAYASLKAKTASEATSATVSNTSDSLDNVKKINDNQTQKLDNITILVDGRYGQVLQELADVKRMFAIQTGSPADLASSVVAQSNADAQHARTAAAAAATIPLVVKPGV